MKGIPGITSLRFILGYTIQDRPEHSEWTGFMSHTGTFSTVPGISFPIRISSDDHFNSSTSGITIERHLSSCNACYIKRRQRLSRLEFDTNVQDTPTCNLCDDWNLLKVTYQPHEIYPSDSEHYSEVMKAKKITFETLNETSETIFKKLYLRQWTKAKASRYAQVECLRSDIVNDIYDHAVDLRPHQNEINENTPVPDIPRDLLAPAMNQNVIELKDSMVGLMHTVILNLGRHLLTSIKDVLSQTNAWKSFYDLSNTHHIGFRKLSLSWCKAWNYGSKLDKPFTGWVSENFLGFAIVCKGLIPYINVIRGIDFRIKIMLIEIICSYNAIIATIMSPNIQTKEDCDHLFELIKFFLSRYNELDEQLVSRSTPKIETASCFLNLLVVPNMIKDKGVLRNFWEGDMKGEGIVRVFKPLIKRGVDLDGTMSTVLSRMYNVQAIDEMIENHTDIINDSIASVGADDCDRNHYDKDRFCRFKSFKNKEEIVQRIVSAQPLMCIFDEVQKKLHFMIGHGSKKKIFDFSMHPKNISYGTVCFEVSLDPDESVHCDVKITDLDDFVSVILIPMIHVVRREVDELEERHVTYYCVRDENHLELKSASPYIFDKPQLYFHTFEDITQTDLLSTQQRAGLNTQCLVRADGRVIRNRNVFSSREMCKEWIGKPCFPIDGCAIGTVVDFKYRMGLANLQNCRWTVKYYKHSSSDRRAISTKVVDYFQLLEILVE